jgi:hypothetical protein
MTESPRRESAVARHPSTERPLGATRTMVERGDDGPWADWTTEQLMDYEERLYDEEFEGGDTWFERDQVLQELARRQP